MSVQHNGNSGYPCWIRWPRCSKSKGVAGAICPTHWSHGSSEFRLQFTPRWSHLRALPEPKTRFTGAATGAERAALACTTMRMVHTKRLLDQHECTLVHSTKTMLDIPQESKTFWVEATPKLRSLLSDSMFSIAVFVATSALLPCMPVRTCNCGENRFA